MMERHLSLSRSEIDSVDTALAWVVQQLDRHFKGHTMVKISVEQTMVLDAADPDSQWRYQWSAGISGMTEQPV